MRHFFALLSFALMSSSLAQVPDYVPSDGLVAWYSMNGDTEDAFGDFDGAPSGLESSIDRFGNSGSCFHFSGGNSHIDLGVDGALVPATALTFAVWMKPSWDASYSQNTIVGRNTNGSGDYGVNWGIYGLPNNRILRFGIGDAQNNGVVDDMDVPYSIEENAWVHYAVAYDAIASSVKFFIDGQLVAEEMTAVQQINDNGQTTFIGKYRQSGGGCTCQWFTGGLDDLGIWNRALAPEELWAIYQNSRPVIGCTDVVACNYVEEANVEDGSCEYGACHCLEGTIWSDDLGGCVVANPSDTDFDGCVGMIDLLDLLSSFGTCVEVPWACGDPLEYQGYDYETVQIGEQCWFAENLRSESYENGDAIPSGLSDSEWLNASSGAVAVYGEGNWTCYASSPDGDACDEAWSLSEYGRLYNWYAVDDARGLCPSGWHVPTDEEWTMLTDHLGGEFVAGGQMKTTYGWENGDNGTNSSGFSGLPGGDREYDGLFYYAGSIGVWWSSSPNGSGAWVRYLIIDNSENVYRFNSNLQVGFSVRCVRDVE